MRQLRKDYVAYVTKMLTLAGSSPQQALKDANGVMAFETGAGEGEHGGDGASGSGTKSYHLVPASEVAKEFPLGMLGQFEDAVHCAACERDQRCEPQLHSGDDPAGTWDGYRRR